MELHFLNQLKDRDITVFVYSRCYKLTASQIAERRNLTIDQVKRSLKNVKRVEEHIDIVAGLQILFKDGPF